MRSFLTMLVMAAAAVAAPPVPSQTEVSGPLGQPIPLTLKVEPGKKIGTAKTFDPAGLMIARLHSDDTSTLEFWLFPKANGTYFVPFWTEGEVASVVVKVVAGTGTKPTDPPVTDPGKPPPVTDPATKYFLAVVRPDGPIQADVFNSMRLGAWAKLKAAGHDYGHRPISELPPNTQKWLADQRVQLPAVTYWKQVGDQLHHVPELGVVALPKTDADVDAAAAKLK